MRRILTEAVARGICRGNAARRHRPARGDAHGQNCGLGVFGEQQLRLRTVETQAAERLAERIICLFERLPTDGERLSQGLAHPDFLRALTREDEGNHADSLLGPRLARADARTG